MFDVGLKTSAFSTPSRRPYDDDVLEILLDALFKLDLRWLREHRGAPGLVESGTVYGLEPPGTEEWCDVGRILERGFEDCDGLACWHAAELVHRRIDVRARPVARGRERTCRMGETAPCGIYHVTVLRRDGRFEDPSALLGMPTPSNRAGIVQVGPWRGIAAEAALLRKAQGERIPRFAAGYG